LPSRATFTVTASGVDSRQANVNAYDAAELPLRFTSVTRAAEVTALAVAAEPRVKVVLDASGNLAEWQPIGTNSTGSTNSTVFSDSTALSNRFYRARTVP
jgi:hypothetical protein